jgi:uncharacterized membrane protein
MWSREFLIHGVASAAFVALVTLGLMWLILAAADGGSGSLGAGMVRPAIVGILVYPLCWWRVIHRARDYSRGRTGVLVVITYCGAAVF